MKFDRLLSREEYELLGGRFRKQYLIWSGNSFADRCPADDVHGHLSTTAAESSKPQGGTHLESAQKAGVRVVNELKTGSPPPIQTSDALEPPARKRSRRRIQQHGHGQTQESLAQCTQAASECHDQSVAKGDSTDDELSAMPIPYEGSIASGYSLQTCRQGKAYVVLPTDVFRIGDVDKLSERMTAQGGYRTEKGSDQKRTFKGLQGDPELVLYATGGRLLVRTERHAQAVAVAVLYIRKWLREDSALQVLPSQFPSETLVVQGGGTDVPPPPPDAEQALVPSVASPLPSAPETLVPPSGGTAKSGKRAVDEWSDKQAQFSHLPQLPEGWLYGVSRQHWQDLLGRQ